MPHRLVKASRLIRHARLIVVVGLVLVLASVAAVMFLVDRSNRADLWVIHTIEIQQTAEKLLSEIQAAESAKRGYLLTHESDYVIDFHQASGAASDLLDELVARVRDQKQQARLSTLKALIDTKMSEMERTLELAQKGQRDEAIAMIVSAHDKRLTRGIREGMFDFQNGARELLRTRQDAASSLRSWLAMLIATALLIATLLTTTLALATRRAVSGLIARTRELEEETQRREEAEETLQQSQKMEAVGQLSGGIAHDFNNLLTIIMGNLDSMKRKLAAKTKEGQNNPLSAELTKRVDSALHGARSAAELTRRLLAFSRRQTLEPTRVDMNRLVADMMDLLNRSLGEEISIETVYGAGLWPAFADPHQLENVLLNLALNAKDAMPDGGSLTIETANAYLDEAYARRFGDIEPGQYVVLCVTDDGTGIPESIIGQVFEPFFTTKPQGVGSGLGLAMVHGFVKQSGGHIRIYSEDGEGTTVKIYLPRMTAAEERFAAPTAKQGDSPVPRAEPQETVLLVEDNEGVRDYAKGVLQSLGYTVLEASDADDALQLLRGESVDLLFTDVVLPGTNGRELADAAQEMHPGLPVLYTTGYARNAIVHQGRLDSDVQLIGKPYTEQDLARKVREILDGTAGVS